MPSAPLVLHTTTLDLMRETVRRIYLDDGLDLHRRDNDTADVALATTCDHVIEELIPDDAAALLFIKELVEAGPGICFAGSTDFRDNALPEWHPNNAQAKNTLVKMIRAVAYSHVKSSLDDDPQVCTTQEARDAELAAWHPGRFTPVLH